MTEFWVGVLQNVVSGVILMSAGWFLFFRKQWNKRVDEKAAS